MPGNDGHIQLIDCQLEADGSSVAHLRRFNPHVDEGDGGVFPRGGDTELCTDSATFAESAA